MENVNIGQTGTKKSEKEIKILMKKYKMPDSICDNPKQQIGYWFENGVQLSGGTMAKACNLQNNGKR